MVYLILIWLIGVIIDQVWLWFDHRVPSWDTADYLNGAMNYWHVLQAPEWLNGDWWQELLLLSSKIPPGMYILTVPFLELGGTTMDSAMLVFLFFNAILLLSVYGMGIQLFNQKVGLLAAAICQILPGLYYYRVIFLQDFPVSSVVAFSFFCLTLWKIHSLDNPQQYRWLLAILGGFSLGFALMIKQTAALFLLGPSLFLLLITIGQRKWRKLLEILMAFVTSLLICWPWYRANWLLILTSSKQATVDAAAIEGDPPLNTLEAWTFYADILPKLTGWPLLIIPIVSFLIYGTQWLWKHHRINQEHIKTIIWLTIFLLGGYILISLNVNKHLRYITPLLPVIAILLAQGLLIVARKWRPYLITGTLGMGFVFMLWNLFPLPGGMMTNIVNPHLNRYPVMGKDYPHQDIIADIIDTSPYLRTTLGVLPSTPVINQHNFSFYGAQANFQVYGRQVGTDKEHIKRDARSLDWFLTQTGKQGSFPSKSARIAQQLITERIETSDAFTLQNRWQLPEDETTVKLYHRKNPSVEVTPVSHSPAQVTLTEIDVPSTFPSGNAIPVNYTWQGNWEKLQQGVVLLTWQRKTGDQFWLHDHGIAMGELMTAQDVNDQTFQVTEKMAMFPPKDLPPGNYRLTARYIHRDTGETHPITTPDISVTVNDNAKSPQARELDLITQFRQLAPNLAEGTEALEEIFAEIDRIHQYDPIQDYLEQAETALQYRLQHQQQRLDWLYSLALSQVLQKDVEGAIASFQQLTKLDSQNPFAYGYLAFVYLYNWQPQAAQQTLETAFKLNSNLDVLQLLDGVAALMQGNLVKAWQTYQDLQEDQLIS